MSYYSPIYRHTSAADNNDLPNGHYLLTHVKQPAKSILSADDKDWRGEE